MPLHEYLEQKRRQNITQLDATGACHICGSTCRNSQGFRHFLDNETNNKAASAVEEGNYSENSMVPLPDLAAMRTCACFGQSSSDPDYWPYSVSRFEFDLDRGKEPWKSSTAFTRTSSLTQPPSTSPPHHSLINTATSMRQMHRR